MKFDSTTSSGTETRYYICSRKISSAEAAELVRGHWHVENKLHLTLDRCLGEDGCRKSSFGMARAWIHALAYNWLRANFPKGGSKTQRLINATSLDRLAAKASWSFI